MSDDAPPGRIAVIWSPEARADLRGIERQTAVQILYYVDRYLTSRAGRPVCAFRQHVSAWNSVVENDDAVFDQVNKCESTNGISRDPCGCRAC